MKAFDRACIIILGWLGVLNLCALFGSKGAGAIGIAATAVCFVLIVYENRISYYEEKAEYYKKLFVEQNKAYLKTVMDYKPEKKKPASTINLNVWRKVRQKSGIDKSKAS